MSSGPEHYRKGEEHLKFAADADVLSPVAAWHQRQAQAHFTAALAAATALNHHWPTTELRDADRPAWQRVAGVAVPIPGGSGDEEPPEPEYDPGPEVDDEGGMSEYRYPHRDEEAWEQEQHARWAIPGEAF